MNNEIPENYKEAFKHIELEKPEPLIKWNEKKVQELKNQDLIKYGGRFLFSRNHKSAKGKT